MTTKTLPAHGTLSRHKYHKCACEPCREASAAYQRSRYRRIGYGSWQPLVDAEPVRQHLLQLRSAGISINKVAEASGLYLATVTGILYGLGPNKTPKKRLRPETAAKILAVQPGTVTPGIVDPTGTRRRLQALAANGWPMKSLAPHIGVAPATVARLTRQKYLFGATAQAVANAYAQLRDQRPEDHGIPAGVTRKARNHADEQGWPTPDYWDDMGHIDDPGFDPNAKDIRPRIEIVAEDAAWLLDAGLGRDQVARRLGVSRFYIDRALRENRQEQAA